MLKSFFIEGDKLQIERLAYFIEVARTGSIKRASENINISQQALSQSMAAMEKELGVSLLERGKNGVTLTKKGKEVKKAAEEICQIWDSLNTSLIKRKSPLEKLCISLAPYTEINYYVKILNYAKSHYPNMKVNLVNAYPQDAANLLSERTIDLAIVCLCKDNIKQFLQDYPHLQVTPLQEMSFDVWVNKNCELAKHANISIEDLKGYRVAFENLVAREQNFLLDFLQGYNIDYVFLNSSQTMQEMIAEDLAIGFGLETSLPLKQYKNQIVRIKLNSTQSVAVYALLICKDRTDSEILQEIVYLLTDHSNE